MYTRRPPRAKRPSQKAVRNQLAWMGGATQLEPTRKTGRQQESLTNDAIAEWLKLQPALMLGRNKRRLATPPGMSAPIMLGWLVEGSADWIGYYTTTITPQMVGRRVAVFVGLESKRPSGGVVSAEQEAFLNSLKDAGGIAAVVRSAEDAQAAVDRYVSYLQQDQR